MQVWNVLRAARENTECKKIAKKSPSGHHHTTLSGYIFTTKTYIDNRKKNLLSSNISSTCPHNMVNFSPLAAEIVSLVWDTPANFNGFHILAALLHGTLVVGVSQTLRHWTEGATYIRQGGHHVGHWPTFLVLFVAPLLYFFCAFIFSSTGQTKLAYISFQAHLHVSVAYNIVPGILCQAGAQDQVTA